jgi:membrane protein DedA with SNARE-associated domain
MLNETGDPATPAIAAGPARPASDQRLPWIGAAQRGDKILIGGIMASGLYYLALLPLVPMLVASHPMLLAMVRGSMTAIVTLGALARTGHGSVVTAALVGLPATIMFDWLYWWAGRRWGERGLMLMVGGKPNAGKKMHRVKRLSARFGPVAVILAYLLPIPTAMIDAAAGWGGMRLRVFLVCDILGGLIWTSLLVGLGYGMGQGAVDVVNGISRYSLYITIGLVVLVVARQTAAARRRPAL